MKNIYFKPFPCIPEYTFTTLPTYENSKKRELYFNEATLTYRDDHSDFDFISENFSCVVQIYIKTDLESDVNQLLESTNLELCLRWKSKSSRQQGKTDKISYKNCRELKLEIEKSTLRGSFDLELIGISTKDVPDQNIYKGSILYEKLISKVSIDGKGSLFPISFVEDSEDKALWWLELNFDNPTDELFEEETISLYINKSNKDYEKYLKDNLTLKNPLLINIYATAYFQILIKVRNERDWELLKGNYKITSENEDTILSFVNYGYRYIFDQEDPVDNPEKCFKKILTYLETRLA
jgi:hypothetical protein